MIHYTEHARVVSLDPPCKRPMLDPSISRHSLDQVSRERESTREVTAGPPVSEGDVDVPPPRRRGIAGGLSFPAAIVARQESVAATLLLAERLVRINDTFIGPVTG